VRNRAGMLLVLAGLLPGVLGVSSPASAADSFHTFLTGAIAFSPSNAWAVGWSGIDSATANSESLHWNGTRWAVVNTAQEGNVNGLEAVSATGTSDVWGVGWLVGNCLIQHYNGQKWANVACPYQGVLSQLNGVDARTRSDAWAVGFVFPSSRQLAFAEHWNGQSWKQVTTATVNAASAELDSVLDLGPANVWAVGNYQTKANGKLVKHALAEHWNGHTWQRAGGLQFSSASWLAGVSGGTTSGVTAVGAVTAGSHNVPLIEHWNGKAFVRVSQPASSGDLTSVTVLSKTSAYAVGETGSSATLMEHFDGKHWTHVATPNPSDGGFLSGVAVTPSGSFAEAVGWHGLDPNERPLIEQGNGHTMRITRS
jgi:hypothetical protein